MDGDLLIEYVFGLECDEYENVRRGGNKGSYAGSKNAVYKCLK